MPAKSQQMKEQQKKPRQAKKPQQAKKKPQQVQKKPQQLQKKPAVKRVTKKNQVRNTRSVNQQPDYRAAANAEQADWMYTQEALSQFARDMRDYVVVSMLMDEWWELKRWNDQWHVRSPTLRRCAVC